MNNNKILYNFEETKEGSVRFTGKYMEVYIPMVYFDSKISRQIEDKIETLAIFLMRIYTDETKKDLVGTTLYELPTKIITKPSNIRKNKLVINGSQADYMILEYFTNDIFIMDTTIVQISHTAADYITMFHGGKVPTFVPYDDLINLEIDATILNKMKFPVSGLILECIASEIARDPDDMTQPFRYAAANGRNLREYKPVSIKQLPTYNSTFSSITFEDIDYQLVASVNKTKYNKKEQPSPIEKTIKF